MILAVIITSALTIVLIIFAPEILNLFFDQADIVAIGVRLLRIWVLGLPFISVWIMAECAFHGAGDNVPPMIISLVSSWLVEIPAVLFVIYVLELNEIGVWWARFGYFLVGSDLALIWLNRRKWIDKKV